MVVAVIVGLPQPFYKVAGLIMGGKLLQRNKVVMNVVINIHTFIQQINT